MRARTSFIALIGTVVMASLIVIAPAAQSATVSPNAFVACDTATYLGGTSVTASPGETFTLTFVDPNCATTKLTYDATALSTTVASGANIGAQGPLTFTVLAGATNGSHDMTTQTGAGATRTIAVTISGGSGGGSLPSWWKEYQRANREEACRTGWNPTYGMWANGGRGGWTCVQELYYSGSSWLTR